MWTSRVRRDTAWRTVTTAWSVGVPIKWPQSTCSTACPVPTSTTACQYAWSFTASGQGSTPGWMPVGTGVGCAFARGVEAGGLLLPLPSPKSRLQAETSIVNTSTSPVHLHSQSGFFHAHVCISFLPQSHLNRLVPCSLERTSAPLNLTHACRLLPREARYRSLYNRGIGKHITAVNALFPLLLAQRQTQRYRW